MAPQPHHAPPAPPHATEKPRAQTTLGPRCCWRCLSRCSSSRWWPAASGWTRRCTASRRWPTTPTGPPRARGTTWLLVGSDSRQRSDPRTAGRAGHRRRPRQRPHRHDPAGARTGPSGRAHPPRWCRSRGTPTSPIPGYGEDKINAAFAEGGAPLLAQTVEQATGLRLDHYAEIGFDGFAVMVDAVGGVTMCPTEPINDPLAGIDLPAGLPEARRPQRARLRPHPRHPAGRPGPDDQPARVHVRAAAPRRQPGRVAQPAALVSDGARGDRRADRRRAATTSGIWRGWRGRCAGDITTTTVPIGEFTGSDSGSVVVWNSDAADQLFAALASDAPFRRTCSTPAVVRIADRAGADLFHLETSSHAKSVRRQRIPRHSRPRAAALVPGTPVRPFCSQPLVRPGWFVATHATPTSRQYRTSS